MGVNKVIFNGDTLVDLTGDTVSAETLSEGVTAHNASGDVIVGTMVQPIHYIESLDQENLVNFRDLESGQYVIYGYFSPYANSDIAISADNSLIGVVRKAAGSHVICLDPLNAKVVFFEILVDETQEKGFAYTRTIIPMLDLHALIEKVGSLDGLNTEEKSNLVDAINEVLSKIPSSQSENHGVVTSGSGSVYTATVEGIDKLEAGATFIMIPHTTSTIIAPKLNVNGLGEKSIRRRLSNSTVSTVAATSTNWLYANKPIRMMYDGSYWIADLDRPNANDIYGTIDVSNGGTGASTPAAACANLGAVQYVEQTLTNEQKAQARANIGAAAEGSGGSGSTTQIQTDWNQTDDSQPDFLRNKPFGEDTVTFADEQTVSFEDGVGFSSLNESAVVGANVTVMWDGVQYNCVVFELSGLPVVGEVGYMDGEVITGEPFLIALSADSPVVFPTDYEKTDAVIQIFGERINKIDAKYVPSDAILFYTNDLVHLYNDYDLTDRTTQSDVMSARTRRVFVRIVLDTNDEAYLYPLFVNIVYGYACIEVAYDGATKVLYTAEYTG